MLTPGYYAHCADEALVLYGKLEERITRDIVRRIVKTGYVTETAKWQAEMLQQSGMLYDDILNEVAETSGASREAIQAVFEDAGVQSVNFDNKIYQSAGLNPVPLHLSEVGMQTLLAGVLKTNGELANLTKTTANTAQTAYINACSIAEMEITSGAFDHNTAIRHAIDSAMEQGVSVKYPSGHVDKLDVAVRRSVMTGVSQTTGKISLANARDMGTDLMEITAHGGARPSHAKWQGMIVSLSGRKGYLSLKDIEYGEGNGFKGYNCRHDWFPYIEGLSSRAYTDEQLKSYQDKTVTYNGKEIPQYEAEQKQRAMERQIREERRKLAGYDEAIKCMQDADSKASLQGEFDSLAVEMKSHESIYKDFSSQTGLPTQTERIQVKGFNRSVSQKAVQAKKKTGQYKGLSAKISGKGIPEHEEPKLIKTIDFTDKKAVKKEIEKFEKEAVNKSFETACVITQKGKVYHCFGVKDRVFPDFDLKDELKGAIISHNHPITETAHSFSDDDLSLFMKYELKMMRGCDRLYTYEFTRNARDIDEIFDIDIDLIKFEDWQHFSIVRTAQTYGVGYRRWRNDKRTS